MYLPRYETRLQIVAAGEVTTARTTHDDPESRRSWVSVRTGDVLLYCNEADQISTRAHAWNSAAQKARQIGLPTISDVASATGVVAQVTAGWRDTWDVTAVGASAARDGIPYVDVRAGSLMTRCYDTTALGRIRSVWLDAVQLGRLMWWRERGYRTLA